MDTELAHTFFVAIVAGSFVVAAPRHLRSFIHVAQRAVLGAVQM
jgi:hypothetical protein